MRHIGHTIRELRKQLKMTQEQLAAGICTRSYVSQIEKGSVVPSVSLLESLAARLLVTVDRLQAESSSEQFASYLHRLVTDVEEQNWQRVEETISFLSEKEPLETKDRAVLAWAKGNWLENVLHDYQQAQSLYEESLHLSEHMDPVTYIRACNSLGFLYGKFGNTTDPVQGYPYLQKAYELCETHQVNGRIRIWVTINMGIFFFKIGNCVKAIEYLLESLQLYDRFRTDFRIEYAYNCLAAAHGGLKRYQEARFYAEKVIEISKNRRIDALISAGCYGNLGRILRYLGDFHGSVACFQKAIQVAEENGVKVVTNLQVELADTLTFLGQAKEAKTLLRNVIEHCSVFETVAEAKFILANLLMEEQEEDEAIRLLEDALHGLEAKRLVLYHLPQAYHLLGKLYKQKGEKEKALALLEKSSELLLEIYTEKRR